MEDRGLGLLDGVFTLMVLFVGVLAIWTFLAGATDATGRKTSGSSGKSSGDWWWSYGSKDDAGVGAPKVALPHVVLTPGRGLDVGSLELVQPQWPPAAVVPAAAQPARQTTSNITTAPSAAAVALRHAVGVRSAVHAYEPIP